MKKRLHIHDYRIVQPYTLKGKFIVRVLQLLYALAGILMRRKWAKPLAEFEENPATYTFEHIAYLGYKYYIQPPTEFDEKTVRYFDEQIRVNGILCTAIRTAVFTRGRVEVVSVVVKA